MTSFSRPLDPAASDAPPSVERRRRGVDIDRRRSEVHRMTIVGVSLFDDQRSNDPVMRKGTKKPLKRLLKLTLTITITPYPYIGSEVLPRRL